MDMRWSPGVRMVLPGICSWANGQEAIYSLFVGQAAPNAQKIWIKRSRPLIAPVKIAASRIGLPDLQQSIWYRASPVIEHSPGHNDALTDSLASSPGIACQIGIFRCNCTDNRTWTG